MIDLPNDVRVEDLTQDGAKQWYSQIVQSMVPDGIPLSQAWARTGLLYPRLAERAGFVQKGPAAPLPSTDGSTDASNIAAQLLPRRPVSLPNASNIAALGLPADASWEEFRAADTSNAGASPRNSTAIFSALVGLKGGANPEEARQAARARFPALAAEADAARNADGSPVEASRQAFIVSALASTEPGRHQLAAAAHESAAAAQSKFGDEETAGLHRKLAKFHRDQIK